MLIKDQFNIFVYLCLVNTPKTYIQATRETLCINGGQHHTRTKKKGDRGFRTFLENTLRTCVALFLHACKSLNPKNT